MAFNRRSCITVLNIIAEIKEVFKNRRKHVIQCFTNEKNISIISLSLNFSFFCFFFTKKGLNEYFKAEMILSEWPFYVVLQFLELYYNFQPISD